MSTRCALRGITVDRRPSAPRADAWAIAGRARLAELAVVASQTCFASQSHLNSASVRFYGSTPGDARREARRGRAGRGDERAASGVPWISASPDGSASWCPHDSTSSLHASRRPRGDAGESLPCLRKGKRDMAAQVGPHELRRLQPPAVQLGRHRIRARGSNRARGVRATSSFCTVSESASATGSSLKPRLRAVSSSALRQWLGRRGSTSRRPARREKFSVGSRVSASPGAETR